jgi:hypothetical protein
MNDIGQNAVLIAQNAVILQVSGPRTAGADHYAINAPKRANMFVRLRTELYGG